MSKKTLILVILLFSLAVLGGVLAYRVRIFRQSAETVQNVPGDGSNEGNKEESGGRPEDRTTRFVTDVDPNVTHWQTKETEFFTIKFPKEWYWKESNREKTGYYSQVITNNPDFDIDSYSDIGVFTRYEYSLKFRNDSEVIISTNNLGDITSNSGTPSEYIKLEMERVEKSNNSARCGYVSDEKNIPLMASCFFVDSENDQKVQTFYASYKKRTFAYTARTIGNSNLDLEGILRKIAESFFQKKDF